MSLKLSVEGMSCGGCEQNVVEALEGLDGVESVDADHEANTVAVEGDADEAEVSAAIENAGYTVTA